MHSPDALFIGGRINPIQLGFHMKISKILLIFFLLVFSLPLSGSLAGCSSPTAQPRSDKPNIILILTDDQPYQTMQYMPTVQKELVAKGVNFTNAYVTTPLCCPSRSSILTGLYVHNHGVKTNRIPLGGATVFNDSSTLPVWLQSAGYHTALMGKYLNDYDALPEGYIPPGWNEWDAFVKKVPEKDFYYGYTLAENGKTVQYGFNSKDYSTDVLRDKAVDFIKENRDVPFFLMFTPYSPHQPYMAADRHKDMFKTYDTFSPYNPPNYFEEDISDKPDWLNSYEPQTKEYVEKVYQRQLRSLMGVDDAVAAIVTELEKEGIRDNTIIIFMSDNGLALGDHRLIGKACPYEACIHVPFVVSYPDKIPASRTDSSMVLNIDIAPTLTELGGIPNVPAPDGQSFLSMLTDPDSQFRDGFLIEQYQDDGEDRSMTSRVPAYIGFRTKDWKYVEYETGERELYDLVNDPYEMDNLFGIPAYDDVIADLQEKIEKIRRR